MFRALIAISILMSSLAYAAPKNYQQILMNEPVSLLDMIVIKADFEANETAKTMAKSETILFLNDTDYDWASTPKSGYSFKPDITSNMVYSSFDFETGEFIFYLEFIWNIHRYKDEISIKEYKEKGELKITQKNAATMCKSFLTRNSHKMRFQPLTHQGYTNSEVKKVGNALQLYMKVQEDTVHKFVIKVGHSGDDTPRVECKMRNADKKGIKFSFENNWHELDEIVKSYDQRIK